MKIIFMGTPSFAVPSLEILLKNNYDIVSVVTTPDKKKGRGQHISFSDIKSFSTKNNLQVIQPENLKDSDFINTIKSLEPDLIIVVAFRVLPKEIFTIPKFGSFNLHASLLPKYRGAAPINWTIINGENETGVTTFFLKEKIDTGNIILQKKISIAEDDDAGTLYNKLSQLGAQTVLETVQLIEEGKATAIEQNNNIASTAPKIFKDDCIINWNQNALKIHNFIRGLSPYPAAISHLDNKLIKIFKARITDFPEQDSPGKILIRDKKLFVNTKDYLLEILELQSEGKKRLSAADFINGIDKSKELLFD